MPNQDKKKGLITRKNQVNTIKQGNSWFFGIGINQYQHFSNLNNAVKDVKDILILLQDRYDVESDHVLTLFDEEATHGNIIRTLDLLLGKIKEGDKLIIYYSGHGHLRGTGENKKGFWIPTDADKDNTVQYIRNSTIRDYIEDIQSLHTLLISDSCFSGSLFVRAGNRADTALEELELRASRWAICSGRHDEEVYDGHPGKNSPLAESILDILQTNQSSRLNVAKLADRVVELTRANYKQLPEGNPLYGVGHKGGQYVFKLKADISGDWAACMAKGTLTAYQAFLLQYPEGHYALTAKKEIARLEEEAIWQAAEQANTIVAYYQYDQQYPRDAIQMKPGRPSKN